MTGDALPPTFVSGSWLPGGWGVGVSLTTEGALDWRHWGYGAVAAKNQKAGVPSLISDYTVIGSGSLIRGTNSDGVDWNDGAPVAVAAAVRDYILLDTAGPMGDGFMVTIPAAPEPRILIVYVGNWCIRARFEASLDDGVTPPFVDTSWEIVQPRSEIGRYTVSFSSATPATLTVRFTVDNNYCTSGDVGEVKLKAMTLH